MPPVLMALPGLGWQRWQHGSTQVTPEQRAPAAGCSSSWQLIHSFGSSMQGVFWEIMLMAWQVLGRRTG
jgi:hypothetical protein